MFSAKTISLTLLTVALLAIATPSEGSILVYGSHSDYTPIPGASLGDVRLQVDMSVTGGLATFSFTNASIYPEQTAVFKTIVLDNKENDTNTNILWNGVVLTNTSNVSYGISPYNVLPGFNPLITDGAWMVEFNARPPAPKKGIGLGETLQVQFNTVLPDGSDIEDYLKFFDGGSDTAAYSVGFQAISASIINGQSLSGAYAPAAIPEPATMSVLGLGGLAVLVRRKRK